VRKLGNAGGDFVTEQGMLGSKKKKQKKKIKQEKKKTEKRWFQNVKFRNEDGSVPGAKDKNLGGRDTKKQEKAKN